MTRTTEHQTYIMGYMDKLSVQQGDRLEVKISTTEPSYRADIIAFDHYFYTPEPERDRVIDSSVNGEYTGRLQEIAIGSYALVPALDTYEFTSGFTIQAWIQPALIEHVTDQGIVARWNCETERGFRLYLTTAGKLVFELQTQHGTTRLESETALVTGRWYFVCVRVDPPTGRMTLDLVTCMRRWLSTQHQQVTTPLENYEQPATGIFTMGSLAVTPLQRGPANPQGCFNGKIDRPRIWSRVLADDEIDQLENDSDPLEIDDDLVGAWDFSQGVDTTRIVDISKNEFHGSVVNRPMRAAIGANWTGTHTSYDQNPIQYGAIWFHEDDLDDCSWDTDFVIPVDPEWPSGVYAARLQAGDSFDYVPFYVRPAIGGPKQRALFLAPTNTYLAYGNETQFQVIWNNPEFIEKSTDIDVDAKPLDYFLLDHPELGRSIYDLHPDGSGVCYSSRLRPVLTMRPQFLHWLHNQARHFAADLYLIEWLAQQDIPYDVATDEDLHLYGAALLADYDVVFTGSHPEYWTWKMLQGLETWLSDGGKLMYLGGNGFYWVTGIDDDASHYIEVRRGVSGIRAWTSHPGEVMMTTTGEIGGLWRNRGLAPNSLSGIGFASEGWGGAPGYVRMPQSFDSTASFIFEGVDDDEIIGDFGLIMDGAAGDEIDRLDFTLGSPDETLRLATTELRHSDYYQLVIEDCSYIVPGLGGTEEPRVRADITYLEDIGGGAVFSTGSINWIGSLMWNDGDNNVSRITGNVLRKFAKLP